MPKRHRDALAIQQGAVNPSGIAHSIVSACAEFRSEGPTKVSLKDDPAIRLMVHQLAFICGITSGVEEFQTARDGKVLQTYSQAMAECRMKDQEDRLCPMNEAQLEALHKIYQRAPIIENDVAITFDQFRAKVTPGPGCVMVPWAGMVLGIEPDGYVHS